MEQMNLNQTKEEEANESFLNFVKWIKEQYPQLSDIQYILSKNGSDLKQGADGVFLDFRIIKIISKIFPISMREVFIKNVLKCNFTDKIVNEILKDTNRIIVSGNSVFVSLHETGHALSKSSLMIIVIQPISVILEVFSATLGILGEIWENL
jgi:hypothetical protein